MNLETYMVRQLTKICAEAEKNNPTLDKAVLGMVYAQAVEVVNSVRLKVKDVVGVLPPMPNVSAKIIGGKVRVTVDTTNWNEAETFDDEIDEDN